MGTSRWLPQFEWCDCESFVFYQEKLFIQQLENDENYGEEMLWQFNELPAKKLVEAIEKAQRVDILVKLKMIIDKGNYIDKSTELDMGPLNETHTISDQSGISQMSTMPIDNWRAKNSTPEKKFSGNNSIFRVYSFICISLLQLFLYCTMRKPL